jgi:hypothetical protein
MLSQLLTTKNKSEVVNLFLANPARSFTLTEVHISSKASQRIVLQTVRELAKMGFLLVNSKNKIRSYQVDKHFALYPELVGLLRKQKKLPKDLLVKELSKLSDAKVIIVTGIFVGRPRIETDILIVGKASEKKLAKALKLAEKFAEQEINYTVMPLNEFEYRKIMSDRFIKNILENGPVLVTDKTKNRSILKLVNRP